MKRARIASSARSLVLSALLLSLLASVPASAASLRARVARIARAAGGQVGVAALHVESGVRFSWNGGDRYPMASVYKLPIALRVLQRVEEGEMDLRDTVTIRPSDFRPGAGPLDRRAGTLTHTLTAESLLTLALSESDNTASDALLRLAGGPGAVTARLREIGIADIDVSRSEAHLLADWQGIGELPPESEWTAFTLRELADSVKVPERTAAQSRFLNDRRDTATPEAMVELLSRIHRRQVLKPADTQLVLRLLASSSTGPKRIKGLLPRDLEVAHKTGTLSGVTNDVGLVPLPGLKGHLAIAIFIKGSNRSEARGARVIAEIARVLYDFFARSTLRARPIPR